MPKNITQQVRFKGISAATLFNLYLDGKKHTAATGSPAEIQCTEGSTFHAHDKYISGKNLQLVKNRLIVQSWRGSDWHKTDLDSTFILLFEEKGKDTIVHMTHADVPDEFAEEIKTGWKTYYWQPWKKYLKEHAQ
jgi:activator of HSP90 ATPase